jgi:hypothetical protein
VLSVLVLSPFLSATNDFGYNTLYKDNQIIDGLNYSINTNYSNFAGDSHLFDGYSSTGYRGWLKTYFDTIYAKITDLTAYWKNDGSSTATGDCDIGAYDFSATEGNFNGDVNIEASAPKLSIKATVNGRTMTLNPSTGAFDMAGGWLHFNRYSTSHVAVGQNSVAKFGVGVVSSGRFNVKGLGNTDATTAVLITDSNSKSLFKVRDDGNVFMSNDNVKFIQGAGDDISTYFNSTDRIVNAEVGNPNAFWTGFNSYNFDNIITQNGEDLLLLKENRISDEGLIGYWDANDNSEDWSGNGIDGTLTGNANVTTTGKFGNSFGFDGAGDYVALGNNDNLNEIKQITVSTWTKFNDDTAYQSLVGHFEDNLNQFFLHYHNAHSLRFRVGNGTTNVAAIYSWTPELGKWYNIVGTYNGSKINVYLDGILVAQSSMTGDLSAGVANAFIGSKRGFDECLDGAIDEVMIYNRSLSDSEISALYESQREMISKDAYVKYSGDIAKVNGNLNITNNITTDNYGFFGWIGSITNRVTEIWTSYLNVDGNLNQTNGNATINNIYGGMWYHNHTATLLNFALDGTFYNMFMPNAIHLNGFTYQGGFNQLSNLTAQFSGTYKLDYMSSSDGQNNHAYYSSIFINEVNQYNCESHHKMSAGGDIITQSGNCIISLLVGDVIDLRVADVGNTGTGNYYSANLNLVRIGN